MTKYFPVNTGRRKGFALPTILIVSVVMITVLLTSVTATSSMSAILKTEVYNQLAQTAADSGMAYVKSCLNANEGVANWTDTNKLRINTDCYGIPQPGYTCPENSVDIRCAVSISGDNKLTSSFSVGSVTSSITGWRQVSSSANHSCAIAYDNQVYCWGYNGNGQLGDNSTNNSLKPVRVTSDGVLAQKNIRAVAVGGAHSCAIAYDNQAYCWGANVSGQLGNSSNTDSLVPVLVTNTGALATKRALSITAGLSHTCIIASDNLVYCWGLNANGQLGDNTLAPKNVPTAVNMAGGTSDLSGKTVRSITAGGFHTCAIASDSLAYCWGYNLNGQLGDNTTTDRPVPEAVNMTNGISALFGKTVRSISANGIPDITNNGYGHTCVVASDSQAYCWGYNAKGQVGNNATANRPMPTTVSTAGVLAGKTIVSIATGAQSTCAVASDGQVYCWGYNNTGQLGNGTISDSLVAVLAAKAGSPNGATARQVVMGSSTACTIALDNQAYCWGLNTNGQLGNGTTSNKVTATQVATKDIIGSTVSNVSISGVAKLINSSGNVWRQYNQTKNLDVSNKVWNSLAMGVDHNCAIDSDSQVYCWGLNTNGQLGDSSIIERRTPVLVTNTGPLAGKTIKAVTAGTNHSCVIASDNLAYCWGLNNSGQLGTNNTTPSTSPVAVNMTNGVSAMYNKTVLAISAGDSFTCALASDYQVYCWGLNTSGQLGDGSTTQHNAPFAVNTAGNLAGKTILSITTGTSHVCVIASDSLAYCWGLNTNGQLGDSTTTTPRTSAVAVNTAGALLNKTLRSISAGSSHTCAIASDSLAYCWGLNTNGQLGDNSITQRTTAVLVDRTLNVSALYGKFVIGISAGGAHSCATASDGGVYCWGLNTNGQLGNRTNSQAQVPVNVVRSGAVSNNYALDIVVRNNRSCLISTTSSSFCWGANNYGQIGNNLALDSNVPLATLMPARSIIGL